MAVNTVLIIIVEVPLNNAMAHWDDRKSLAPGAFLCAIGFGAMFFPDTVLISDLTMVVNKDFFLRSSKSTGLEREKINRHVRSYR